MKTSRGKFLLVVGFTLVVVAAIFFAFAWSKPKKEPATLRPVAVCGKTNNT